ncbi:tetraspanin-9 [Palaemon carinicauda]|uniref:tetraspanin-9 n=1 Tax=Palaemon carinicauda TaxID=392227 RepID=UPI0035B68283
MGRGVEMTGCGRCLRFLMFGINFIIWVASIVILVLGIWTVVDRPYLEQLLGNEMYMNAAYILIATGCLIFFVSFLGCFGALKEIKCMLLTYFIFVLLLFVILLIGGILGYVFKDKAGTTIKHSMTSAMKEYSPNSGSSITKAWDETQIAMKCCGIESPLTEWLTNINFSLGGNLVPRSCCKKNEAGELMDCQRGPTSANAHLTGCYKKATEFVASQAVIIGGVAIAVAAIMLLGLILSIALFKMID